MADQAWFRDYVDIRSYREFRTKRPLFGVHGWILGAVLVGIAQVMILGLSP